MGKRAPPLFYVSVKLVLKKESIEYGGEHGPKREYR
jgi:hypothetical protein